MRDARCLRKFFQNHSVVKYFDNIFSIFTVVRTTPFGLLSFEGEVEFKCSNFFDERNDILKPYLDVI